ncbi:MAG: DUF134 domain-containing protein [Clostridiaceae bacterium]
MVRPRKNRRVFNVPDYKNFGPYENNTTEEIIISIEEVESLRLMDIEDLDQEECAKIMDVARSTFQRIYKDARYKVAESIINGKKLHIDGGNYKLDTCTIKCSYCGSEIEIGNQKIGHNEICPNCGELLEPCTKDSYLCRQCRRGRGHRR